MLFLIGIFYCKESNKSIRNYEKIRRNFKAKIVKFSERINFRILKKPAVDFELYYCYNTVTNRIT